MRRVRAPESPVAPDARLLSGDDHFALRGSARSRSLLERPAPGLVTPPPRHRRLPAKRSGRRRDEVWLLGTHGGAGVSSLLRAGVPGEDTRRAWPADGWVLLVARTSAAGLRSARDAARQHASGTAGAGCRLVGLVLVADAPGRLPASLAAFADLVAGAFPRVYEVPWLEEWRQCPDGEVLPAPPEVRRLADDLRTLTADSKADGVAAWAS
jgi:hypothetical protein